jgi:serine/threonine protein phosphatase PrpC
MQKLPTPLDWPGMNLYTHRQKGTRKYMEDRYNITEFHGDNPGILVVVCDGHGGARCANFAAQYFPKYFTHIRRSKPHQRVKSWLTTALSKTCEYWDNVCFRSLGVPVSETQIQNFFDTQDYAAYQDKQYDSGSTLLAVYFHKRNNTFHILNLGDSRVLVGGTTDKWYLSPMHRDVEGKYLCGTLGMTHAIGDNDRTLTGKVKRSPGYHNGKIGKDSTFLVATDGLWDEKDIEEIKKHGVGDSVYTQSDDNMVIIHINFGRTRNKKKTK